MKRLPPPFPDYTICCSHAQYDIRDLLAFTESRLLHELLPTAWSLDPAQPGYILKCARKANVHCELPGRRLSLALLHCRWIIMAEQLQLDGLKWAALAALRPPRNPSFQCQIKANLLDADLAQLSMATLMAVLRETHAVCLVRMQAPAAI